MHATSITQCKRLSHYMWMVAYAILPTGMLTGRHKFDCNVRCKSCWTSSGSPKLWTLVGFHSVAQREGTGSCSVFDTAQSIHDAPAGALTRKKRRKNEILIYAMQVVLRVLQVGMLTSHNCLIATLHYAQSDNCAWCWCNVVHLCIKHTKDSNRLMNSIL